MHRWILPIVAAVCVQGLFLSQVTWAADSVPTVTIEEAWIRAMPPTLKNTAAYLTVVNRTANALEIVGASTNLTEYAEIHTSREVDGYVRMEQLLSVSVPPGQALHFSPGGRHLMLLGLEKMPSAGSVANLCLIFTSTEKVCVDAPVQKGAAIPASENHQHHH